MNPNICNNCGGEFAYRRGKWVCLACGSYKPETITGEEMTLLYTAYQKLRLAEFSEAELEFDDILRKYPKNPNAYWGRLMARYGIKYERDFDGRMIPTCYATSIESLLSSQDYQMTLKYADTENKSYFKQQAEYIERVRKEWIEKAKKEKPYDVFLCYKESDLLNGIDRTQDSLAMQELYVHLTSKGYRVFYSHESLREKVGEKYEPYIFNALSTAKVMIVYGSKPEYITSVWMKNEWTRYEKRMKSGEKKQGSLFVACDGFQPGELPSVLASMQCMNARDKSFYSDLDESIEKIIYGAPLSEIRKKKRKERAPIVITTLVLLLILCAATAWYFLRPVTKLNDSRYGASVRAEYGSFLWNTALRVEALSAGGEWKDLIATLPVDTEGSRLYQMSLRNGKETMAWEGDLTVSIPLPEDISESRASIYELSGDTAKKVKFDIIDGKIVFKTHQLSVYLITKREHTVVIDDAIAPTCTAQGYTEGSHCSDCLEVLILPQTIPALGHVGGTEATCTAAQMCTVCGETVKPALGHTTEGPSCIESQNCKVCGVVTTPTGHRPSAVSCTEAQICTECGKELASPTGHNYQSSVTTPTCTSEGYTLYLCRCGDFYKENIVSALGHTSGAEATCSSPQYCTVCLEILTPALEHIPGNTATCAEAQCCMFCGAVLKEASAHTPGEWTVAIAPTATKDGLRVRKCTVCGNNAEEKNIPATGSQGLAYKVNFGTQTCSITGIGDCKDTDVVIPSMIDGYTVTKIANNAFAGSILFKSTLTSVVIPDTVAKIGMGAFGNCDKLVRVVIGDGVTHINASAFRGCDSLTDIVIGSGVKRMGAYVFQGCKKLENVVIKDGASVIGRYAFANCTSLTSLVIPGSVKKICNFAFSNCKGLTVAIIENGVERIGARAFLYCKSLARVTIPESVEKIGESAFNTCSSLEEIRYDGTTEQWAGKKGLFGIRIGKKISFGMMWDNQTGGYSVYCTDGTVSKTGGVVIY